MQPGSHLWAAKKGVTRERRGQRGVTKMRGATKGVEPEG